ncbi:HNH endonuclease [Rhodoferax sp. GW822-FHT02A01]|uniref:HNH endonuclease n=1 Tax=Rhodoferax sp. GW822-FHT02A01 TaxID=3141537 RepID=UPI00315CFE29
MKAKSIAKKLAAGMAAAVEVGDCLEWQGKFACKGVTPVVPWHNLEKHRTDNAPVVRLLWEAKHGPIPAGHLVYKTCCNNACVLDGHLACGTRKDWAKARKKAGVTKHSPTARIALTLGARRRANVKNTMDKAREIRSLSAGRMRVYDIAKVTGVHPTMVADMRQGRSWRELGGNIWQGLAA